MRFRSGLIKTIAVFTVIAFLTDAIGWAVPACQLSAVSCKPLADLFIPEQYGRINKSQVPSHKPQVILIKDAHCVYEAQRNIEKILDILIKDYKIDLVCVEGARNDVNTSIMASYPDNDRRKEVINKYVKKGLFTASEALSIKNGLEPGFTIYGVEDEKLYWKNFQLFRRTIDGSKYAERFLDLIKKITEELKEKLYSDRLKEFDKESVKYKKNDLLLIDWVGVLRNQKPDPRPAWVPRRNQKNFNLAVESIDLEGEIDFEAVEKERKALIKELEKTLPKEELKELIEKSLLFKLGKIPSLDYYTYLKQYVNQPNLYKYVQLIELQSRIDEDMLFKELDDIEDTVYEMHIENEIQRKLYQLDRDICVLEKILHIQATREEIAYYKKNKERFVPENLLGFIKIKAPLKGIKLPGELTDEEFINKAQRAILPAEEFYNLAIRRDRAIVDNLIRQMKKENKDRAVLVAGGFHGDGIKELLEEKGINCVSIVPVITKIQENAQELYLKRMLDPAIDPVKMTGEAGFSNLQAPLASPNDLIGPGKERFLEELLREPARDLAREAFKAAQESLNRPEGEKDETDKLRELLYKLAIRAGDEKKASIENEEYRRMLEEEYLTGKDELYAQFLYWVLSQYYGEETMRELEGVRNGASGAVPMQGTLGRDIREDAGVGKATIPWFQKKFGIFGPIFEELVFRWIPFFIMMISPFLGIPLLIASDVVFVKLHLVRDKDISIFVSLINTVFILSVFAVHLFSPISIWILICSVVFVTLFAHYFWNKFSGEFYMRGFWLWVRRGMLIGALLIPFILPGQTADVEKEEVPMIAEVVRQPEETQRDMPVFEGFHEEGETKLDLRKLRGRMPVERNLEQLLYDWYKKKIGRDLTEMEEAKVKRQAENYRAQGIYNPSPAEVEEVCGRISGLLHTKILPDFSEEQMKIFLEALLEAESDNRHWIVHDKNGKPEVYVLKSFSGTAYGISQITEIAVKELGKIVYFDLRTIKSKNPEAPAYKRAERRLKAIYLLLFSMDYSADNYENLKIGDVAGYFEAIPDEKGQWRKDFRPIIEHTWKLWEYNIRAAAAILLTTFDYIQEQIGSYKDGDYPIWRMAVAAYNWSKYGLAKAYKKDKYLWILQTSELSVHTTRFRKRYEQLSGERPAGVYWGLPGVVERLVEGVYNEMAEGRFGEARAIINKMIKDWTLKKFLNYAEKKKLDIQKIKEYLGIESDEELNPLLNKTLRQILLMKIETDREDIPGPIPLVPPILLIGGKPKGNGGGDGSKAVGEIIDGQEPRILQYPSDGILKLELKDRDTKEVKILELKAVSIAESSVPINVINMLRRAANSMKDSFYRDIAMGILGYVEQNLGGFYFIEDNPFVIGVADEKIICLNQKIMEFFGCLTALLRVGGKAYLNAFPEKSQGHTVPEVLDYLQREIVGEIDSRYYRELTSRDPIIRRLLREGYSFHPWDGYFWLRYDLKVKCKQGWKLHIAAARKDAVEIMYLVLPIIRRYELPHKIVNGLDRLDRLNSRRDTQVGKFICVYIDMEDREEAASIAGKLGREIDRILAGKGFGVPEGILWDKEGANVDKLIKLKEGEEPSGLVGYRYGSFKDDFVELENGLRRRDDRGVYKPRDLAETVAVGVDIEDEIRKAVNRLGLSQEELDILVNYLEFMISSSKKYDTFVFRFRYSLEKVSVVGEKLFDRVNEEISPHLLIGEDKDAFYGKLCSVLKEVLESTSREAATHKVPGGAGLDEETKDGSEREFVMKEILGNRRREVVIPEEIDIELSARIPSDKPDLGKVKVVVVEDIDSYGFSKGADKDKAKDLIYAVGRYNEEDSFVGALGEKNGIVYIYVTQKYWDEVLSQNPPHLSETIDHEWQENVLSKSHREAAGRARFFVKEGETVSEYHRFSIGQLIEDGISGALHLLGILREKRTAPKEPAVRKYERNFRKYIRGILKTSIDDAVTKMLESKWRKGSLVDVSGADRLVVIGDLHGRYDNLMDILARDGIREDMAQGKAHIVILGDAIHPGSGNLESPTAQGDSFKALLLLIKLISMFPENVHYIMGDHELAHVDEEFSVKKQDASGKYVCQSEVFENYILGVYGIGFLEKIRDFLGALPCIGRINKDIVVTHAGSSKGLESGQLEGLSVYDEAARDIMFKRDIEEDELDEFLEAAGSRLLLAGHTIPIQVYGEEYGFSVLKEKAIGQKYGKLVIINSQTSTCGYADIDMCKSESEKGIGYLADSKGDSALKTSGIDVFEKVVDEVWAVLKKWKIELDRNVVWEVVAGIRKGNDETGLEQLIELAKGAGIEPYGLLKLAKEIAMPLARMVSLEESANRGKFLADILAGLLVELDETGKEIAEGENLREMFFNTVKTMLVDYGVTEAELAGELELIKLGFFLLEYEPLLDLTRIDKGYFDYLGMVCELAGVSRDTLNSAFAKAYYDYQDKQIADKLDRGSITEDDAVLLKRKGLDKIYKMVKAISGMMEDGFKDAERISMPDSSLSRAAERLKLYRYINDKGIKEAGAVELDLDTVLDFRDAAARTPQALVTYLSGSAVADVCGDRLIKELGVDKNKKARISIPEGLFIEKLQGDEITYLPGLAAILRKMPNLTVEIRAVDREMLSGVLGIFISENPDLKGRVSVRDEFKDADDLLKNKKSNTTYVLSEKQKDYEGKIAEEIKSNNLKAFCTSSMALYSVLIYGALYASVERIFENDVYTDEGRHVIEKLRILGISKEDIEKIIEENRPFIVITTDMLLRQYQLYRAAIAIAA